MAMVLPMWTSTPCWHFIRAHGKLATVTGINPASRFGELKIDGDRVDIILREATKWRRLINGGFFVFNRAIFNYLSVDDSCDLEVGPLEKIAKEGQLMVYKHRGFWACMDTLRDMEYLNKIWDDGTGEMEDLGVRPRLYVQPYLP